MNRCSRLIGILGVMLLVPALGLAAEGDKGKDSKKEGDKSSEKHGHAGRHHHGDHLSKLNLTDDQKTKVAELRKKYQAEFESILTPEQKKTFEDMKKAHEGHGKKNGQPGEKRPEGEPKPKD